MPIDTAESSAPGVKILHDPFEYRAGTGGGMSALPRTDPEQTELLRKIASTTETMSRNFEDSFSKTSYGASKTIELPGGGSATYSMTKEEIESHRKLNETISATKFHIGALTDVIASASMATPGFERGLAGILGIITKVAPEAAIATIGIGAAIGAITSLVKAYDAVTEKNLEYAQSLAQVGGNTLANVETTWLWFSNLQKWGKLLSIQTGEDTEKISKTLNTIGKGMLQGWGTDITKQEYMKQGTEIAAFLEEILGVPMQETAENFNWMIRDAGMSIDKTFSVLANWSTHVKESGLNAQMYSNSVKQLHELTKAHLSTFDEVNTAIKKFADQIGRETLTIAQVAQMLSPEKWGSGKELWMAGEMAKRGLGGEELKAAVAAGNQDAMISIIERMKVTDATAFLAAEQQVISTMAASGSSRKLFIREATTQLGLGGAETLEERAKQWGVKDPEYDKWLKANKNLGEISSQTAKDIQELGLAAWNLKRKVHPVGTFVEQMMMEYGNMLPNMLKYGGVGAVAGTIVEPGIGTAVGTGIGLLIAAMQDLLKQIGGSRATGGLIPSEGLYHLHAGENVQRSGEGGGVGISFGPGSIVIGGGGSLESQIDMAAERWKESVMQEIGKQWREAQSVR